MLMLFITAWFENESSEPIVPDIQIARIYRPGGIVAAPWTVLLPQNRTNREIIFLIYSRPGVYDNWEKARKTRNNADFWRENGLSSCNSLVDTNS